MLVHESFEAVRESYSLEKKRKNKNERGVTLLALVITIIVLLILAGVTIAQLTGNGLLNKATSAKDETTKSQATEAMNLKITNIQISSYSETQTLPNLQYLADKLCEDNDMEYVLTKSKEHASLDKIDVTNISSIFTKLKEYPYEFEINSSLQLASIDGIKIATVPSNDDDTIVSMTKAELDNYINTSIENALKNVSPSNSELQQTLDNITKQSNNLLSTDAYGENNEFSLSENITNYKYLLIYCGSYAGHFVSDTMLIETSQIRLSGDEQFDMSMYANSSIYWRIAFCFTSQNKIKILYSGNKTWEAPRIYRIVGLNYIGE